MTEKQEKQPKLFLLPTRQFGGEKEDGSPHIIN